MRYSEVDGSAPSEVSNDFVRFADWELLRQVSQMVRNRHFKTFFEGITFRVTRYCFIFRDTF